MPDSTAHDSGGVDDSVESAIRHLPSHLCFWTVGAVVLWLDLWSKSWAFHALQSDEVRPAIAGLISFRRSLNDGAVFGSFRGNTGLFIVASLFALVFVFYLFAHSARRQWILHIALALILAGALGNLYDRAFVMADVVIHRPQFGQEETVIGQIGSDPRDPYVRVGDWPDGGNAQRFLRSEVVIRRQGVVRDFIKFVPKFPDWVSKLGGKDVWPWVFNVADSALVCGVIVLLLSTWLERTPHRRRSRAHP